MVFAAEGYDGTGTEAVVLAAAAGDTVCVEIIEAGTGSGYPLYTDSVRVNYLGRLISTDLEQPLGTLGEPFDHSGYSSDPADVFDPRFAVPATFLVRIRITAFTEASYRAPGLEITSTDLMLSDDNWSNSCRFLTLRPLM